MSDLGPLPEPDIIQHVMTVWIDDKECQRYLGPRFTTEQMHAYAAQRVAAERERHACWFALVMNAAAALEDAANCLRDQDAKRAAEGAAKHYRTAANDMWVKCVGPNDRAEPDPKARGNT
jgi:hypothetical protein